MKKVNVTVKFLYLNFLFIILLVTKDGFAWGQNGHRIVAHIASAHVSDKTRQQINVILNNHSLAAVSTWVDEMRSAPDEFWQKNAGRWYYINLDAKHAFEHQKYFVADDKADVQDIYSAVLKSISILNSTRASLTEKQFYLKMLTHLIGALHQPMHVGHGNDHGGNLIEVSYFGKKTNLHSVWDTELIEGENLSFTQYAQFIDTLNHHQVAQLQSTEPHQWIHESFQLAQTIYQHPHSQISYSYVYQFNPIVKKRLLAAGIRLAGLLNHLFDKPVTT